jgi:CubicO group peptidase (beta-lactamase class C family)
LKTRIFDPLGMEDTGFFMPPEQTDQLPTRYVTDFQTGKMELQTLTGPDVCPRSRPARAAFSRRSTTTWRSRGC